MKIKANLQELIDQALSSPAERKDYCYYDGCPTTWYRAEISKRNIKGSEIRYVCGECANSRFYQMGSKDERKL